MISVLSERIPVDSDSLYDFSCQVRIKGSTPKFWNYITEFVGIRFLYFNGRGDALDTQIWQTAAPQTVWQPVTRYLDVPDSCTALQIELAYESQKETDGCFQIDDIRLKKLAPTPARGFARLVLKPVDEKGQPTFARLQVRRFDGALLTPKDAFEFSEPVPGFVPFPADSCLLDMASGIVMVEGTKGFEYEPVKQKVVLQSGQVRVIKLIFVKSQKRTPGGWYAGDHNQQLFLDAQPRYPFMTVGDVMHLAQAEGLNFLSLKTEENTLRKALNEEGQFSGPRFVGSYGLKISNEFWGNLTSLNATKLTYPVGQNLWPLNSVRMDSHRFSTAHVFVQPYANLDPAAILADIENPEYRSAARELPIVAALGHPVSLDLLSSGGRNTFTALLRDYYRLLNLGFKIGVTGSSGADPAQGNWVPGNPRTYVHTNRLTMKAMAEAYCQGRTIATNGPVVSFKVNGHYPGETVMQVAPEGLFIIELSAFSNSKIKYAEILLNGKVIDKIEADANGRIEWRGTHLVPTSCWVAARVYGAADFDTRVDCLPEVWEQAKGQFAHTSPVYLEVQNRPIFSANTNDIEYYLNWLNAAESALHKAALGKATESEQKLAGSLPIAEQMELAKSKIDAARKVFENKL
ncbi:CehA/McbA family metallohydrolase, partial [bacterium]|nr:CehA/McbA family metallohydrolase [bacterium]